MITIRKGATGRRPCRPRRPAPVSEALAVQIGLAGISSSHIIDAHHAIVIMSAELAAHHATPEDITLLDSLISEALSAGREHWGDTMHGINLALARASKNPALAAQMEGFMEFLRPYYQRLGQSINVETVVRRYRAMLDAVRRGDAIAAFTTMYEHLRRIRELQATS
ncbi:MAG: FCD domain-containing protein [Sphingomonas sp.]